MAGTRKHNGKLKTCLAPKKLNKVLIRKTFDDNIRFPQLSDAKIFTKNWMSMKHVGTKNLMKSQVS